MKPGSWIAETGDSYDRVADRYADLVRAGLEALPLEKRLVDHFAQRVAEAGGGPVLDIGCGPGLLTRDLASRGLAVSGIDISTAMLRLARTKTQDSASPQRRLHRSPLPTVRPQASSAGTCCTMSRTRTLGPRSEKSLG
ncbi:methyltransferase domain-containing protein [Nocardioides mesophilus]|uniref:Methyltransferase domain-containing protein n=1 Tax=Nocardioides mesophilus TaxID=433659 RepID=A0A7G9RGI9_9ACTN|nr:methyltransferase domain-containing protein [Nocardioides mesophilus]